MPDRGDAFPLEVFRRQEVGAGLLQLFVADRLRPEALGLAHAGLHRADRALEVGVDVHRETARVQRRVARGVDALGEAAALLHASDESAAVTVSQNEGQQVHEGRVPMGETDRGITELEMSPFEGARQKYRPQ